MAAARSVRMRKTKESPADSPPARHCGQCGAPLSSGQDGDAQCFVCLVRLAPSDSALTNDDTVIEEGLSLSDVLSIVRESRR